MGNSGLYRYVAEIDVLYMFLFCKCLEKAIGVKAENPLPFDVLIPDGTKDAIDKIDIRKETLKEKEESAIIGYDVKVVSRFSERVDSCLDGKGNCSGFSDLFCADLSRVASLVLGREVKIIKNESIVNVFQSFANLVSTVRKNVSAGNSVKILKEVSKTEKEKSDRNIDDYIKLQKTETIDSQKGMLVVYNMFVTERARISSVLVKLNAVLGNTISGYLDPYFSKSSLDESERQAVAAASSGDELMTLYALYYRSLLIRDELSKVRKYADPKCLADEFKKEFPDYCSLSELSEKLRG